jgi:class 3 adenylate cyclase
MVTVLFADIEGFDKLTGNNNKFRFLDHLDRIRLSFDRIIRQFNIRKIKTIGDVFLCAGGIDEPNFTNPVEVLLAALQLQHFLSEYQHDDEQVWALKIGIHTGPVTASVTGRKKVSYDIKGDTVNIAARIESVTDMGAILISGMTYELVKEFFVCEYWGKLPVKYKGNMVLYRVLSLKPELSEHGTSGKPNEHFRIKFKLIQFTQLQEAILDMLEKELPKNLYYHSVKHTVDVVTEVELIGWAAGVTDEEMLLLKTAALFHDAGHIKSYADHEEQGCLLAREILPAYEYTPQQIDRICELIMATEMPPSPKNLLEEIICDSDLDYLGRADFIPVSNSLFQELQEHSLVGDMNTWNKRQIEFISKHHYYTKTARALREVNKQKQIERIQSLLTD